MPAGLFNLTKGLKIIHGFLEACYQIIYLRDFMASFNNSTDKASLGEVVNKFTWRAIVVLECSVSVETTSSNLLQ